MPIILDGGSVGGGVIQVGATTRQTLVQNIAKELGYATGTCSGTGLTTTVVDTSTDSPLDPDDDANLYDNAWLKIESDSAETPLDVGAVRRVSSYVPSTGTLTLSRALGNATTSTQTYGLYQTVPPARVGVHKGIGEYVNDVLRQLRYRIPVLLSLAADADMESTATTDWTQVGTCTISKDTGIGITAGRRSLKLVTAAINSGAKCTTDIAVSPGEVYDLAVDVLGDGNTAKLLAYDETNDADIANGTVDTVLTQQRFLATQITIPTGCYALSVRLLSPQSGATLYFDNLSVRRVGATEMALPSWFSDPDWLEDLYYVGAGQIELVGDSRAVDDRRRRPLHWWGVEEDHGGTYRVRYWPSAPTGYHLYARCMAPYGELSLDADATDANPDLVKAWALKAIYDDLGEPQKAQTWLVRAQGLYSTNVRRPRRRAYAALEDV